MTAALERVEASRARLRLAMMPPPPPPQPAHAAPESWLDKLGALPLVHDVIASLGSWWSSHPMRPVADVASEATSAVAKPIAQRHPLALVLIAGLAGAGIVWSRPWRWVFRSALFAGLIPQLASRVVTNLPIESWMTMVGAALSAHRAPPAARAPAPFPEGVPDAPTA